MKDTILWNKESDNYTKRAKISYEDLYNRKTDYDDVEKLTKILPNRIKSILDIGCGFGGFTGKLAEKFPRAKIIGIDPGKKTIALAKNKLKKYKNLSFRVGHSHKINLNGKQFDLIILRMVFQWIPRKYLFKTIAEIDKLCKNFIFIKEFYPAIPSSSKSIHDKEIKIFKQDYAKIFTSVPWYKLIYKKIWDKNYGDNFQRGDFLIKKCSISKSYIYKKSVQEKDKKTQK
jgi:ubiquinone/menaquinone biosynthesis C-methylase UbiE